VLNTYRDILDSLATALLEKETLDRNDLEVIFAEVEKRPRITTFDEFGPRLPSDRPPIKTPGELAIERGEPWPPPESPEPPAERQDHPVPIGALNGPPGQSGYTTGNGGNGASGPNSTWQPPAGYPADPNAAAPPPPWGGPQQPPNWTGGVLPGPLAPMPGWQPPPGEGGNGGSQPGQPPSYPSYPSSHPEGNGGVPKGRQDNGQHDTGQHEIGHRHADGSSDDDPVDPWAPPSGPRR
jgi:cell division protease FtsH